MIEPVVCVEFAERRIDEIVTIEAVAIAVVAVLEAVVKFRPKRTEGPSSPVSRYSRPSLVPAACQSKSLPDEVDGAVVMLGDMPEIAADLIDRLISAFAPKEGRGIVVPVGQGKRGNPVLWGRDYFNAMADVTGDTGAKHLLGVHADAVVELAADAAVHADVDTPEALAALRERVGSW